MGEIRIVEYDKKLAKGIADMWNRSGASWGGKNALRTEESVITEHENSTLLTAFIALDGDEVVGYCSFAKYQNDEGALFIPLLNVRPDYHGKKIGKTLVRKAVEKTAEMGWPRLDLFTWPGNTKAVPLYKKCGFFWEEREDSTHLMNFIPTVLKTEAFADFFSRADWYNDSRRTIEIKPDGIKENGFTYYEYLWEKDGSILRVQFEKTGRGMRLVETDDFLISTAIDGHGLVFGMNYKIRYHMVNKTNAPLEVTIKGSGDKNINYCFETKLKVEGTIDVEAEFRLGETDKEQNTWRTHPAVISEITVNRKKMTFKTGIEVKFPASLCLTTLPVEKYLNSEQKCFLEIENNFNETALFSFNLPQADFVKFDRTEFRLELKARERISIPLMYRLHKYGIYEAEVPVNAQLCNGTNIKFIKKISQAFRGNTGKAAWEGENDWFIYNGPYMASLNKNNNNIYISCHVHEVVVSFAMPKLGRPYTSEFSLKPPERVEYEYGIDSVVMKAYYYSEDFKGIELVRVARLYSNGIFEHHYELNNLLGIETSFDVYLNFNVHFGLHRAIIPYEGRYIELNDESESDLRFWDSRKVTENWLFARDYKIPRGICWPESYDMKFTDWALSFEKCFGRMVAYGHAESGTITVALGTYKDWHDFRAFATGKWTDQKPSTSESIELIVNNGNPFTNGDYEVVIKENKSVNFTGDVSLSSGTGAFKGIRKNFMKDNETRSAVFRVVSALKGYDTLKCSVDFENQAFEIKTGVFVYGNEPVKFEQIKLNNMNTFRADNGIIQISAAPEYSYGIFSMVYKGQEWLDTLYPQIGPKSWWNPFVGGICCKPDGMTNISVMRQARSGYFVILKDNMGNTWSGIKLIVKVNEHEKYKGLEYNQYFLLLPGLPVLCHVTEVIQNTGRFFSFTNFKIECFFKPGKDLENCWMKSVDHSGGLRTYKAGRASSRIGERDSIIYGSTEIKDGLQIYVNKEMSNLGGSVDVNTVSAYISGELVLESGEKIFMSPAFFIFTDRPIDARELKSLRNIKFLLPET